MRLSLLFTVTFGLLVLVPPAAAAPAAVPPPTYATPEAVNIDPERLARLTSLIQRDIEEGRIPGAVVLISRNGKIVLYEAYGRLDPARPDPMPKDAIFRIFSMSKTITAVAALRLVERGDIQLSDALANYLPGFKMMQVFDDKRVARSLGQTNLRPAIGDIILLDLLRHTAGFADEVFYTGYTGQPYRDAGVGSDDLTLAEAVDKVAPLPLIADPGRAYSYSETSFTVLGRVLELVDGKLIEDVLETEVFEPLGMVDTGFQVSPEAGNRVAQIASMSGPDAARIGFDPTKPRRYHSPAAGLVTTALDFWRLTQMLLDKGRGPDGRMFLAPVTVDTMLSKSLDGIQPGLMYSFDTFAEGFTYGLGVGVKDPNATSPMMTGRRTFFWLGADGTMFFGDPDRNLAAIVLVQASGYGVARVNAIGTFVMQSVRD